MPYFGNSSNANQNNSSPSRRRPSHVFVNDYTISSLNNFAPAANADDMRACEPSLQDGESGKIKGQLGRVDDATPFVARIRPRFLSKLSPPRSRLPEKEDPRRAQSHQLLSLHGKHSKAGRSNQETTPECASSSISSSFNHKKTSAASLSQPHRLDELQVDFPSSGSRKQKEKLPGKERRKVFQRLADERVPDEDKFKNRKLKSNYIQNKFGSIDGGSNQSIGNESTEISICASYAGSIPDRRSSTLTDGTPCPDDLDDNFVDGLIFFAPTSESTIRELVQKQPSMTLGNSRK